MKTIASILQRIAFSVAVFCIVLLCGEALSAIVLSIRDHLPHRPENPFMLFEGYKGHAWVEPYLKEHAKLQNTWYPYAYWRTKPFTGKFYRFNSEGLRYTANQAKSGTKGFNIFMFGGSTIYGLGSRDDYTIPSCLSRTLSHRSPIPVKITNFGQLGYTSTQEMITLLMEIQHNHVPDLVIFYDGANDPGAAITQREAGVSLYENRFRNQLELISKNRTQLTKWYLSTLYENSSIHRILTNLYSRLHPVQKGESKAGSEDDTTLALSVAKTYMNNLGIIEAVGRAKGFATLFYWQPLLYTKKIQTPYEQEEWRIMEQAVGIGGTEFFKKVYAFIEASKDLKSSKDFHNISHFFDNDKDPIFLDAIHISEDANGMIAKNMAEDILPLVGKTPAKPASKLKWP